MKIIEKLSKMINEELADSEKYIRCALTYKEEMPDLAKVFFNLSQEEMRHSTELHNEIVKIIEDYRREHGEPPTNMMAIYDYLHDMSIEQTKGIKILWDIFRE